MAGSLDHSQGSSNAKATALPDAAFARPVFNARGVTAPAIRMFRLVHSSRIYLASAGDLVKAANDF
jgi:hypothetical protein